MVEGKLQVEGAVIHVIVERCYGILRSLKHLANSDNNVNDKKVKEEIAFPEARNFR
jgi:error-prone DNA polymerase